MCRKNIPTRGRRPRPALRLRPVERGIHYVKRGRAFGPVSIRDFLEMFETQVIAPEDLVRIEGDGRWTRAGRVVQALREGRTSVPPSAMTKPPSNLPAGGHTVFTSAPAIPKAPLPRELQRTTECAHCGTPASLGALFCKSCGTRLGPRACAACQRDNDADAHFCEHCGTRLPERAPA